MTIQEFAKVVETQQLARMKADGLDCEANILQCKTTVKVGRKYTKIDLGTCGHLMVDADGNIFGIKAYGVIHKGHQYGTLETVDEWNWSNYSVQKKRTI